MRLKGIEIRRETDDTYTVTPLYHSKNKGTMRATHLVQKGKLLAEAVSKVLTAVIARGDLKG